MEVVKDKQESNKIPSLDGLRAISIFLVIIGHLVYRLGDFKVIYQYKILNPILVFISDAHLGVQIFFVISGFLITFLLLKEEFRNGVINLKSFYIRRTLRIFPAYYFLLLIYFVLELLGTISVSNMSWITSITYTRYFYEADWLTGHFWSLSVEEHFYLFWPIIFTIAFKYRIFFQWLLIVFVPIFRIYLFYYPIDWIVENSLFLTVDSLAIGCLVAIYFEKMSMYLNKIFFYLAILILGTHLLIDDIIDNFIHNQILLLFIEVMIKSTTNFAIAYIIVYSIKSENSLWFKFLNLKWVVYIGMLSYSIYLWQQLFINDTTYIYNQFPFNIIGIIVMALFSYYVIEKPFLKLKDKFKKV